MNDPIWFIIGFQQRHRKYTQILNIDPFHRAPVTSGQCVKGDDKIPRFYHTIKF